MKALYLSLWLLPALVVLASVSAPAADEESCAKLASRKLDKVAIASEGVG